MHDGGRRGSPTLEVPVSQPGCIPSKDSKRIPKGPWPSRRVSPIVHKPTTAVSSGVYDKYVDENDTNSFNSLVTVDTYTKPLKLRDTGG